MSEHRTESDSMGEVQVPASAFYGASTQRAVENFPISGQRVDPKIIRAYGLIKFAAAQANRELDELPEEIAKMIETAALEIHTGEHDGQFPVDVYQTGSGTSTNMNVNEVIANLCSQVAGNPLGSKDPVHPNDHVNKGQSSNDTFPTALHVAVANAIKQDLIAGLTGLHESLKAQAEELHEVLKIGRTHTMDATPVRLGQEFRGYARQLELSIQRANKALDALLELPLGGTAVGTGLNCHPEFPAKAIATIAKKTGIPFREAEDHFEAQGARDALVECHGQINTIASSLFKIANDIRLLNSGPRCGIGEITIPSTQPGSSIMPGKVNPVMSESMTMVAARVFGNQTTVAWCGANGHFELNVMMPVMGQAILESIEILSNASFAFATKCVDGIVANEERCEELIELSLSMVTSLVPLIGYDKAAAIAKESVKTGVTVRKICERDLESLRITQKELDTALDPASMTGE